MKNYTISHSGVGPHVKGDVLTHAEMLELAKDEAGIDRLIGLGAVVVSSEGDPSEMGDSVIEKLTPKTLTAIIKDLGYSGQLPKTAEGLTALIKTLQTNASNAAKVDAIAASLPEAVVINPPAAPAAPPAPAAPEVPATEPPAPERQSATVEPTDPPTEPAV